MPEAKHTAKGVYLAKVHSLLNLFQHRLASPTSESTDAMADLGGNAIGIDDLGAESTTQDLSEYGGPTRNELIEMEWMRLRGALIGFGGNRVSIKYIERESGREGGRRRWLCCALAERGERKERERDGREKSWQLGRLVCEKGGKFLSVWRVFYFLLHRHGPHCTLFSLRQTYWISQPKNNDLGRNNYFIFTFLKIN